MFLSIGSLHLGMGGGIRKFTGGREADILQVSALLGSWNGGRE